MKITTIIFAGALALISLPASSMTSAEFFARDRSSNWTGTLGSGSYGDLPRAIPKAGMRGAFVPAGREYVARIVVAHAQQRLGKKWTADALAIAKIENNFRCSTQGPRVRSHGGDRAQGPMQVMPRTARAMGLDPRRLSECEYGVMAGIRYMELCIKSGVRTPEQMASCYVSGTAGWRRGLARRHEKYRQSYTKTVMRNRNEQGVYLRLWASRLQSV